MVSLIVESEIINSTNLTAIAGLDEAGRGALAGPVVAAAVMFAPGSSGLEESLSGVNDSKQLSAAAREEQYHIIKDIALSFGIGSCPAQFVDQNGIIAATKHAMQEALEQLEPQAEYLLIDGRIRLQQNPLPQLAIVRGDSKSLSIAAASILAKVTRDRIMIALDAEYPQYGFARHKGYGTEFHRQALAQFGPSLVHRHTFSPLRASLL